MSMLDSLRDKATDAVNDITPEQQAGIEQLARDKSISIEEARDLFFLTQDKDQDSTGV